MHAKLWQDENGFVVPAELVLVLLVLLLGLGIGLDSLQKALQAEWNSWRCAGGILDQSYSIAGQSTSHARRTGRGAISPGSCYRDAACQTACNSYHGDIACDDPAILTPSAGKIPGSQ